MKQFRPKKMIGIEIGGHVPQSIDDATLPVPVWFGDGPWAWFTLMKMKPASVGTRTVVVVSPTLSHFFKIGLAPESSTSAMLGGTGRALGSVGPPPKISTLGEEAKNWAEISARR